MINKIDEQMREKFKNASLKESISVDKGNKIKIITKSNKIILGTVVNVGVNTKTNIIEILVNDK